MKQHEDDHSEATGTKTIFERRALARAGREQVEDGVLRHRWRLIRINHYHNLTFSRCHSRRGSILRSGWLSITCT
jgi:hypothetical protein